MIPSRELIQVRLEDTEGRRLQCKPPVQVKILRRPQPLSSDSTTDQTNSAPAISNKDTHIGRSAGSVFDDDYVTTDKFSTSTSSSTPSSDNISERQNGTTKPKLLNYSTVAATNIRKVTNSISGPQIKQKVTVCDRTQADTNASNNNLALTTTNSSRMGASTTNKKPLKTYQERADEYAKARLRILGSAFPENEALSAPNNDDVDRIFNF